MIVAILVLSGLLVAVGVALYIVATKQSISAIGSPTPETQKIEAKTKLEARAIVDATDKERQEVANANAETILQRVRARVASGLRK